MSINDKYKDDDYVAKLLAEDAKKSSQRYAAVGLSALLPKRHTTHAPKPNTRFLNNLVREADNHNAALKKKEELEARIRLRKLKERERERENRDEGDDERRRKRQRTDDGDTRNSRNQHSKHNWSTDGDKNRLSQPESSNDEEHRRVHKHHKSRRRSSRERQRSNSPRRGRRTGEKLHHERLDHRNSEAKKEHKTRQRSRSRSPLHSHPSKDHQPKHRISRNRSPSASSSDPLDALLTHSDQHYAQTTDQPQIRGRGALAARAKSSSTSNIDKHFSSTYDPSLDAHPEVESFSEREDWDMALEALRDRTAWKKKQAERMREAGFGDDEIRRWEKTSSASQSKGLGGAEDMDVREMKWARKGEAREWDLGKKEPE